jgi:CubicO group peptidase (beta-lactamase class C family)
MTRNQIPGIGVEIYGNVVPEAEWGFGWAVHGNGKWRYFEGSLHSQETFSHPGAGGVILWMDPVYEIVGAYFSVELEITAQMEHKWNFDLFQNAVTAAISD